MSNYVLAVWLMPYLLADSVHLAVIDQDSIVGDVEETSFLMISLGSIRSLFDSCF